MDAAKIAETLLLIGSDLPAYRALFGQVLTVLHTSDQDKLRAAYADACAASDRAHAAVQAL